MKKSLPLFAGLLILFFCGLFGKPTEVKGQAFDMSYRDTSTVNSPAVRSHAFAFEFYQNCAANMVSIVNLPVIYQAAGTPVNETATGSINTIGNPFCINQPPVCSAAGPLNYQKSALVYTFSTKTFSQGQGNHLTRILGSIGNFQAANIAGNFGLEPMTNNILAPGLVNLPPKFVNPPVIFANVNRLVSFSSAAVDADGDSLVYRLQPVSLNATYAAGFTYLNPIAANPALVLNSRTGSITFQPTVYNQAAGPGATANKYVIGLEVHEYRKLNGVITRIGSLQRNILVNVVDNGNFNPVLTAFYKNKPLPADTIVEVMAGTQVQMNFGASDPDNTNYVVPVSNVISVLPNATYGVTLAQNPNGGILHWTPTAADVRSEPYFFNVAAQNNACPYPISISKTFGIRVKQVTGIPSSAIGKVIFTAFPNPAGQEVNFRIKTEKPAQRIFIYNLVGQQIDQIAVLNSANEESILSWKNAGKFASGTYLAKLVFENKTVQTLKFTKLQ